MMKTCIKCRIDKSFTDFQKRSRNKDGYEGWCKVCMSNARKDHYKRNKEWYKQNHSEWYQKNKDSHNEKVFTRILKQKYNLTREEYNSLLENNPLCNICKGTYTKIGYIDHCHSSGKVRGVLCSSCNTGLGHFKDNISSLEAAIEYLKRNQ